MSDPTRVTATKEPCSCGSIQALFAWHRDFPETRGEGQTAKAAASRLGAKLTISLDHAPTDRERSQIRDAIDDANAFAAQCGECGAAPFPPAARAVAGVRGILVGLDGSPHSASAVRLGIGLARQTRALLVGLAIVDEPTIAAEEPALLGGVPYADPVFYRERLADAHRQATGFLEQFSLECADAGVPSKVLEDTGLPADAIALEAQRYDLVLMGQHTRYHFEIQERRDDTLARVLRSSPCPVIVVPEAPRPGQAVVVAYDGSTAAARALHAFESAGLACGRPIHIISVNADRKMAARHAERAHDFLWMHDVPASAHAVQSEAAPGGAILDLARSLDAGMIVLGPHGRSQFAEFFLGSTTRTLLEQSTAPLFLCH